MRYQKLPKLILAALITFTIISVSIKTNTEGINKMAGLFEPGGLFGSVGSQLNSAFGSGTPQSTGTYSNISSLPASPSQNTGTQQGAPSPLYFDTNTNSIAGNDGLTAQGNPYNPTGPSQQDIQAQQEAQARQNNTNIIQGQAGDVRTSATDQINSSSGQQRGSILDYFTGAGRTQQGLNQRMTNAEMSKNAGGRDVMSMVGRGVRSGMTMLSNKNAGSSSAAGQIAQAYGDLGNRENQKINNQYGLEQQDIGTQQMNFNEDVNTFKGRKLDEWKTGQADSISNSVRDALANLNAAAQGADLGTLFQIEQEKQNVKAQALAKFGELDNLVATESAKLNPLDTMGARSQANSNEREGMTAPQMFDFNDNAEVAQSQFGGASNGPMLYSNMPSQRRRGV